MSRTIITGLQIIRAVEGLDPLPVQIGLPHGIETDIAYVEWADGVRSKIVHIPVVSSRIEVAAIDAKGRYCWRAVT